MILTKESFVLEASPNINLYYPNNGWHRFVDKALEGINADQRLQDQGGMYLQPFQDRHRQIGIAAFRWERGEEKVYSMMCGLEWEISRLVERMMHLFNERSNPRERADLRKRIRKAEKKKTKKG